MTLFALFVVVAIAYVIATANLDPRAGKVRLRNPFPYQKISFLLSPAERSFFGVLEQAVGGDYRIFAKVRVADVISVVPMRNRTLWQRAFNRISAKHFDFVLCDRDSLSVVGVIELDDKSHRRRNRQVRDAFLVEVCRASGLPLLQIPASRTYSMTTIRAQVRSALGKEEYGLLTPDLKQRVAEVQVYPSAPGVKTPHSSRVSKPSSPACPACHAPLVKRQAKIGPNAGQEFWGCSAFPKCRMTVAAAGSTKAGAAEEASCHAPPGHKQQGNPPEN